MTKTTKTKKVKAPVKNWTSEIMAKIAELRDQGALFLVSHSGGKDSQAMFLFLKDLVPKNQLIVVHSHLAGVEWEGVVEHIENTISGHELIQVQAKKDFFQIVEERGMWPSSTIKNCQSTLKRDVIQTVYTKIGNERGAKIIVNCMGIRAAESTERSKKTPIEINKRSSNLKRIVWNLMPIFNWTTEDVFGFIRKSGQEPHWAYSVGMSRLSCCFCVVASPADLKISAKYNPEILEKIAALEKKIGHTMKMKDGAPIGIKEFIAAA